MKRHDVICVAPLLVMLLLPGDLFAQDRAEEVISYDVQIWRQETSREPPNQPVRQIVVPVSALDCNQSATSSPADVVDNPSSVAIDDPTAAGRDCRWIFDQDDVIFTLPVDVPHVFYIRARGGTMSGEWVGPSNAFRRRLIRRPPQSPRNPRALGGD